MSMVERGFLSAVLRGVGKFSRQSSRRSAKSHSARAKNLYYLGMSRFQLNDASRSRAALERALAGGLNEPLAADAKRVLAELKKK
jgi:hypothetical protein